MSAAVSRFVKTVGGEGAVPPRWGAGAHPGLPDRDSNEVSATGRAAAVRVSEGELVVRRSRRGWRCLPRGGDMPGITGPIDDTHINRRELDGTQRHTTSERDRR